MLHAHCSVRRVTYIWACVWISAAGSVFARVQRYSWAEHSAIAAMITASESGIARIVAISGDGKVLPPCGRCRELMYQIDQSNLTSTEVILDESQTVKLSELLPRPFHEVWGE